MAESTTERRPPPSNAGAELNESSGHRGLSYKEAYAELHARLAQWQDGFREPLAVLEAGGGSMSHIRFRTPPRVTVVDISEEQLQKNVDAKEKIRGDLHSVDLGGERFDLAVAWNVIEHLEQPKVVLEKMQAAVRPGGVIVLAWPNPASLQGMITKWSPHWFHVLIYKYAFGHPNAGQPGWAPFKTVHHADISPDRMRAFARAHGLKVLFYRAYESPMRSTLRNRSPVLGWLNDILIAIGNRLTGGCLEASDIFLILQKPEHDEAQRIGWSMAANEQ